MSGQDHLQLILSRATFTKREGFGDSSGDKVCDLVVMGGFLYPPGQQ